MWAAADALVGLRDHRGTPAGVPPQRALVRGRRLESAPGAGERPVLDHEETVKSTPARGVKEILKPRTYKQSEGIASSSLRACLLKNEPASVATSQG